MSSTTTTGAWVDPDDVPELKPDWFDRADVKVAGEVVAGGDRVRGTGGKMSAPPAATGAQQSP